MMNEGNEWNYHKGNNREIVDKVSDGVENFVLEEALQAFLL